MSEATQFGLLRERRFLPFFIAQACGAFNDNLFKNVLIILVTYQATRWSTLRPELLANIAAGVFILPFVVFSGLAGQLGERFDKARILKSVKALEIAIMIVAGIGFAQHWVVLLLFALFMMGAHSTFSPRPSTGYCRRCSMRANWSAATRSWKPARSWRSCSEHWLPVCSPVIAIPPGSRRVW